MRFYISGAAALNREIAEWCEDPSGFAPASNVELFSGLLVPMSRAHDLWREKRYSEAVAACADIRHWDWRHACREWLTRRQRRSEQRREQGAEQ